MAMTARARAKGLRKSRELLGPDVAVRAFGIGVVGPDPRQTATVIVLAAAAVSVLFVLVLNVIPPGGVLGVVILLVIYWLIDRPAAVVIADRGVAILERSWWSGVPTRIAKLLAPGSLAGSCARRTGGYVHVPAHQLWLRAKEYERLCNAVPLVWSAPPAATAPPEYPPPPPLSGPGR
ncbi:MAG: hypothetical protein ABSA31_03670 [Acidimicrobiales bacterium]|jgi:hypothetical protein